MTIDKIDIPILLIVFNRPEHTQIVFNAIRQLKPARLYISSDGPRITHNEDSINIQKIEHITSEIDWPCNVHRVANSENLGCKLAVISAIDWFFENEAEGIILEDDCVPTLGFFHYCSDMLSIYREQKRVYSISGSCFFDNENLIGHYFSDYALMWGWATWRDRWKQYEASPANYRIDILKMWWRRPIVFAYWIKVFASVLNGSVNTWDYQWILTVWRNNGLVCRPTRNLVKNIGFGEGATHTLNQGDLLANHPVDSHNINFMTQVSLMKSNQQFDRFDEVIWAKISIISVILMYLPIVRKLKKYWIN